MDEGDEDEEGVVRGGPQAFFATNFARPRRRRPVELGLVTEWWPRELRLGPMACHRSHDKERAGPGERERESAVFFCVVTSRRFIAPRSIIIYIPISPLGSFSRFRVEILSAAGVVVPGELIARATLSYLQSIPATFLRPPVLLRAHNCG